MRMHRCITVGGYGGLVAGGGYSTVSSLYGLAADQVVQLQAVTADGRFVSADSETNPDLFYAMRGGGGSRSSFPLFCTRAHLS